MHQRRSRSPQFIVRDSIYQFFHLIMNLNVVEAVGVEETERFIVEASLLDEDAIPEKSVVQAAPQYTKNKLPKSAVGWYKSLKKALTFHKEPSETAQKGKLRPQGVYTFLYGGRVNKNTFYDYKDQSL
ncbi:hypothetical protein E4T56_gene182 [Termitomyces sp. T112]|nr:hypothetical protein E4T56_gene182 [Termitomyces sp. T112]KAH0586783.1 hypothetical protein H2248_005634 [Termitomyces sp. 'cryptogamus']